MAKAEVVPAMRVRAAMVDDAIYVCLADLIVYARASAHDVDEEARQLVLSLLYRLGEALESE